MKNDAYHKENVIDKKVISNFLLSYFNINNSYHTKLQVLETLSSVLNFSEEDRVKVGLQKQKLEKLSKKQESLEQEDNKDNKSSLKDKLFDFLMNDEEK